MTNNEKKDFLSSNFLPAFICLVLLARLNSVADEIPLVPRDYADSSVRVKTILDVAGSLHVETLDKKPVQIPTEVTAELFYDEVGLQGELDPSVRHYWDAKAEFQIGEHKQERRLREERQLIVLNDDNSPNRFWSPHGMLRRDEMDLLDVVCSAFPPEKLLPQSPVDESETWPVDEATAGQLLRLSQVTACDITNSIQEASKDTVKIALHGTVEGIAYGAKTKIEVQGKYHFDRKSRIITWLALALRENREIGFAAPGFEITARIRCARQLIEQSDALPKDIVAQIQRMPTAGDLLMEFVSDGDLKYQAALDRRWHLVQQHQSTAKLRFVDDGDLLTTCKIDRLNRTPADQQLSLEGFQMDVRAALDKNCKEILSASESVNPQGIRILRVVAAGDVAKTPIRWIYYHLSDDDGQRLSMVFTHEASMESRIARIDESLAASIKMVPRNTANSEQAKRNSVDRF